MNDRYLFRGKRTDNGKWREGYLSKSRDENKQLKLCIDYEEKGVMCSSIVIVIFISILLSKITLVYNVYVLSLFLPILPLWVCNHANVLPFYHGGVA